MRGRTFAFDDARVLHVLARRAVDRPHDDLDAVVVAEVITEEEPMADREPEIADGDVADAGRLAFGPVAAGPEVVVPE